MNPFRGTLVALVAAGAAGCACGEAGPDAGSDAGWFASASRLLGRPGPLDAEALAKPSSADLELHGATAWLPPRAPPSEPSPESYDPLAAARSVRHVENLEAGVPSVCYTKTAGVSNPCWTCHTAAHYPNAKDDWDLQEEYAFSDEALTNHWTNVHVDRRERVAAISDEAILAWIRQDNYEPLRRAMEGRQDYLGWRPDLDLQRGFDEEGFARDGSGWRAIRYKPFLGPFWPTNGSTDDVFVRLPEAFRTDADGVPSRAVYQINLAIVEANLTADGSRPNDPIDREVEPIDEALAGFDLDGDGRIGGTISRIRRLPERYVGGAADVQVRRSLYPAWTEFLHSVRYVDPDAPDLMSQRMKELRYARKTLELDAWAVLRKYEQEFNEKEEGLLPIYTGSPEVGLRNTFGWQLQGWIEDEQGRLRLQTLEEQRFCMGCHTGIGVTIDQTFAFPRKVPGAEGWRVQDTRGIPDVPQLGHGKPEILTYFERVGGGDELRANGEILARFFADGQVREAEVRRAAPGGDRDIHHLIAPSRERALQLNKAYRTLVEDQSFTRGRDALLEPATNVHDVIENGATDLAETGSVYGDGRLLLDWSGWRR